MSNYMSSYSFEAIEREGKKIYIVSFIDGNGNFQRSEINFDIYDALSELNKIDRNLTRSDERNLEYSELTDETLVKRSFKKEKSLEELVLEMEIKDIFWKTIEQLPDIQRKRFLLYYEYGFSLKEIAEIENCSIRAIQYSLEIAKKKLKIIFKKF